MKIYLLPTSRAEYLAKKILAKNNDLQIIFPALNKARKRYFSDGEVYIKIKNPQKLKNQRVIILHSGAPKPNEGLMELELILEILKENKIKPEVFFAYFPYGTQDEVFEKGEINVAESLIKKLINYYQVKKIYIIEPHFAGQKWLKKYPIVNISTLSLLMKRAREDFGENILFFSPDKGGQRRTGLPGLKKERLNSGEIKMNSFKVGLKGKAVAVIDDLIKTGNTLLKFYEITKKSGVKKVIALVTHGVLPSGVSQIKKKYSRLYLTNTIEQKGANIDITDLILKTISKL